jgi:hypothetical protein
LLAPWHIRHALANHDGSRLTEQKSQGQIGPIALNQRIGSTPLRHSAGVPRRYFFHLTPVPKSVHDLHRTSHRAFEGKGVNHGSHAPSVPCICRSYRRAGRADAARARRRTLETVRRAGAYSGPACAAVQQAELVQRRPHLPVVDSAARRNAAGLRREFESECGPRRRACREPPAAPLKKQREDYHQLRTPPTPPASSLMVARAPGARAFFVCSASSITRR